MMFLSHFWSKGWFLRGSEEVHKRVRRDQEKVRRDRIGWMGVRKDVL